MAMTAARKQASLDWQSEMWATLKLAGPLILAQLASMLLLTTDVVMMGWLGPKYLAAGSLATSILHPTYLGGVGVVTATGALVAQALGARTAKAVRRIVRQGFWVAIAMSLLIMPFAFFAAPVFVALGQNPETAGMAALYLRFAVFMVPTGLGLVVLRGLLQAKGDANAVLVIAVAGVLVNIAGDYVLMFGKFGFPRLELVGAGIATSLVNLTMFGLAALYATRHRRYRRYHIFVRLWRPDWGRFFQIVRIGVPIGLTLVSEVGLFGVAVIFMGWLGTNQVAAHAVAVQLSGLSFMLPLGLSQATTVRVGLAAGAGDRAGVGRAGWVSFWLSLVTMGVVAFVFLVTPEPLVGAFLDPSVAANQVPFRLAVAYLTVAAFFQLFDGTQVVMNAALRGLNDTRFAMGTALVGYWVVGLGVAYLAGFNFDLRGVGIWLGLAAGLGFVGIVLWARFLLRERFDLMAKVR